MIIGKGMIANALKTIDCDKFCFFASGVSSSNTDDQEEFNREKNLLESTIKENSGNCIFVYFSSCGIEFETTPYFIHKKNMENITKEKVKSYYIFRLPQVVGLGGNKNTLFNYLIEQVVCKREIEIWKNVRRNLIDIDDVILIIKKIIDCKIKPNSILNIASPFTLSIVEIINSIENILNIKIKYNSIEKGQSIYVDITEISKIIDIDEIFKNKDSYIENLIKKYYKEII